MDGESLAVLTAALLVGTPVLSLLGAIGAALTLGLRASGSLLALLILPLYVPVLIFGAGAVDAVRAGLGAAASLSLLGAGLLIALVGAPFRRRGGRAHCPRLTRRTHGIGFVQLVQVFVTGHVLPAGRGS